MAGGVSDSGFNQRNGYLEQQRLTQETLYPSLTFMIIAIVLRWQHDRIVGSLFFSLPSWRGNHRVGNIGKRAGLISTGFQSNRDPIHFNKVRTTWALRPISCSIQCCKTTLQILSCLMTLSIWLMIVSCNIKTEQEHCCHACWACCSVKHFTTPFLVCSSIQMDNVWSNRALLHLLFTSHTRGICVVCVWDHTMDHLGVWWSLRGSVFDGVRQCYARARYSRIFLWRILFLHGVHKMAEVLSPLNC